MWRNELSSLIQKHFREEDLISRDDDISFIVLLGCGPEEAQIAAKRVGELIHAHSFVVAEKPQELMMHVGIAGYPHHKVSPEVLLKYARTAFQLSQKPDRDNCLIFSSPFLHEEEPIPLKDKL